MKNILYVFSTIKKTGPVNIVLNLLEEIDRTKFNPMILSLTQLNINEISAINEFEDLSIECHCLNLNRFDGFLYAKRKILNYCILKHVNTVHLIGIRADLLVRGKVFANYNLVSTVFSDLFIDYTMLYGKIKGSMMAYLHLKSLKNKTKVACSKSVEHALSKWVDGRFIVIMNSVSKTKFFVASNEEKIKFKNMLNLDLDKIVFIYVGLLINRKDPITAISGFLNSTINKAGNAILLVVGDGVLRSKCEDICIDSKSVYFMGNTPDTLLFLQASDYYIASSLSEGLPTSVIEALSCGLVPILSRIEPHNEILDIIKTKHFTFEPGCSNELSSLIDNMSEFNFKFLSNESRMAVENVLNSNYMADKYQSIY